MISLEKMRDLAIEAVRQAEGVAAVAEVGGINFAAADIALKSGEVYRIAIVKAEGVHLG